MRRSRRQLHQQPTGVGAGPPGIDAAHAVLGATIPTIHAAMETAVVGLLYTRITSPRSAGIAAILVQAGFAAGALAGADVIESVPRTSQTLILGSLGTMFLGVGVFELDYRPGGFDVGVLESIRRGWSLQTTSLIESRERGRGTSSTLRNSTGRYTGQLSIQ